MKRLAFLFIVVLVVMAAPVNCCISDPSVTVVYSLTIDMELLKSWKHEGFSFEVVYDVIPSFGAAGKREFIMYRAHYGLATAMVAYDMVVMKAHEEKYDWQKGVKTELIFLQTIGVLGNVNTDTISKVASWESTSGKNLFAVPGNVQHISFMNDTYNTTEPVMTDYFYFQNGWIAVPGNATVSLEGNTLVIMLMRCGAEISADTSKMSVFAPFTKVLLVCNSIDYELTGKELVTVLEEKGFTVQRITPQQFEIYRWFSPKLIFLGGHKSPEGMGEIVDTLLLEPEKQMIEKQGMCVFAHEDIDFRKQGMLFLAGKDREETHDITFSRIEDILMWLEYIP
ncbi:MAG: hypothetical protein HXS46_09540 [Theionarchaea archaeon]|nr:MAG: hypothetical protein AYK18_08920 [Theionarchaea archaeon DG-70]MBU7010921.1 hypothetical protein [Theionarchaea archaeon]